VIDDDATYEFTHEHWPTTQERILPDLYRRRRVPIGRA
jgi:hypothetical protein